jgi:hypothetical protein
MKYIFAYIIVCAAVLASTSAFAQYVENPSPTETEVRHSTDFYTRGIISSDLDICGLGVSFENPQNVQYMPNPRLTWTAPNGITLTSDRFVRIVGYDTFTYKDFTLSGTFALSGGKISFSVASVDWDKDHSSTDIDNCVQAGIAHSIARSMTSHITPSSFNTISEDPNTMKCMYVDGSHMVQVYDSRGASNYIPPEWEMCPNVSGSTGTGNGDYSVSVTDVSEQLRVQIDNPLGEIMTIPELIKKLFDIVLVIAVPLTAIMIIFAGFLLVTSRGDQKKLAMGKKALVAAVIGGAIVLGAWVIAEGVGSAIEEMRS